MSDIIGGKIVDNGFTPVHTEVAVGASTTAVLVANTTRTYALFINDSTSVIYLNIAGAAAVANKGIRLNASGGAYEMSLKLGNISTAAINAISDGANKNLLVCQASA